MSESSSTKRFVRAVTQSEAIDFGMKVLVPLLCLALGWAGNAVVSHETRLGVIEQTRYTGKDAEEAAAAANSERMKLAAQFASANKEAAKERAQLAQQLSEVKLTLAVGQATGQATVSRLERVEAKVDAVLDELRKK